MKVALAGLLARLRHATVDGAVPESVFVAQTRTLGLGEFERERLRSELARLGLPVRGAVAHADGDSPDVEKVVRNREENVCDSILSSGGVVRALLGRYVDPEGYVTARAVDGVARLAGLSPSDAAALRSVARVRAESAATAGAVATTRAGRLTAENEAAAPGADFTGGGRADLADLADVEDYGSASMADDEPFPLPEAGIGGGVGDLTAAVAAALAVLKIDRVRRKPGMYLLSAEAEVGLAVLIRGGPEHMAEEPDDETLRDLPPDDLRVRARDCFVLHNQRLVHKMVPRYLEQGLDYDDLFQHGALGLMRAARKFDPTKGFKFSTYATWWVRQSITRGIADEGAVIRIPVHMHEQIRKVALAERTLAVQGRPAGVADVAVYCDMTMRKVEEARKLSRRTDSLDRVVGDGVTLGDFIGWTNPLPAVDKGVLDRWLLEEALAVVDTFTEREARILVRRLGLDGDEPSTLDELGREFGVTRERIRQIEVKALVAFRDRLRSAGLTGAYRYEGGGDSGAEASADAALLGGGAGARMKAGVRRRGAGEKRVHDVVPSPVTQEASREGRPRLTEVPETSDGERLGQDMVAEPGEYTADGEELKEPAADVLSAAPTAPAPDPEEQAGLRSEGCPDDPSPLVVQGSGTAVTGPDPESRTGQVQKPRTEPVGEPAPERSHAARTVTEASGPSEPALVDAPTQYPEDWQKALRLPTGLGEGVAWLAEYALVALGYAQLTVLLGPSAADAVVRAVRDRKSLDRPVITALEVLRRVFDTVKGVGLRPEDFFGRPAEALVGVTPLAYLAAKPLVLGESRLAVRDSLREFVAEVPPRAVQGMTRADSVPGSVVAGRYPGSRPKPQGGVQAYMGAVPDDDTSAPPDEAQLAVGSMLPKSPDDGRLAAAQVDASHGAERDQADTQVNTVPESDRSQGRIVTALHLDDVSREHEVELTRLQDEAQRELAEARQSADARRIAALAHTEQRLDALEETLLHRVDKALLRRERHLNAQAEERIARLRSGHREEQQTLVERAEHALQRERAARTALAAAVERGARAEQSARGAEQLARSAEQRANDAEHRASTAEERVTALDLRANEAQRKAEETAQRLRRYREEGETRIAGLEHRLRQAEALLAERDGALHAARGQAAAQVEAAEQRAAARIAQIEHDAWARTTELQKQLADEREAAANRSTLRDRWRRA
ncbi:sigma-70 family RNA polymerase sigma factor [Streptomyces sp. NPDC005195]|uniref:sigma-70 family RNA polymerase sigma factor n=1 Tax=Streptomyces sp. NPDC005195 TaxID=3154561 RepID=UPI0033A1F7E8